MFASLVATQELQRRKGGDVSSSGARDEKDAGEQTQPLAAPEAEEVSRA